jgi:DNA-binding NtrC family response regulator
VSVPPLRDRPEDIGRIIRAMALAAPPDSRGMLRLQTRAFRWMLSFPWPFNRRQLTRLLLVLGETRTHGRPLDLQDVKQAVLPARATTGGAAATHLSALLP